LFEQLKAIVVLEPGASALIAAPAHTLLAN
jgi:hypothetical protein